MNKVTITYTNGDTELMDGDLDCGVLDGTVVIREVEGTVDKTMKTVIIPLSYLEQVVFEQNVKKENETK